MKEVSREGRPLPGILAGHDEPIFDALPGNVLANLRRRGSENSLLWNLMYPLAGPTLSLIDMLGVRPLWGTAALSPGQDDPLRPYFWGYDLEGKPLPQLKDALEVVDGPGPATEIDLLLLGDHNLVAVEAKRGSGFGRCSRYGRGECPEIHGGSDDGTTCRYWQEPQARFARWLDVGERPQPGDWRPPCDRHYQLARTLTVGRELARRMELNFHLWAIVPRAGWRRLERTWIDFADRVLEAEQWRRLRVLAWEDLAQLAD